MARPWVDYMARSAWLLQQGRFYADVAYFYGEEAPLVSLYKTGQPADAPRRYAYDFVNADVLLHKLSVQDGDLVAASGARYRVLFLGGSSRRMTLATLRRLHALAERRPPSSAGAGRGARTGRRSGAVCPLVKRMWSGAPATRVGKGRVIDGARRRSALAAGQAPDVEYAAVRRYCNCCSCTAA
jgi:hypothetical protein